MKDERVAISKICENPYAEKKASDLPLLSSSASSKPALPSAFLQLVHLMLAYLHVLVVGKLYIT